MENKRNIERFPEDFMFQLSDEEFLVLRSQIVTGSKQCESFSEINTIKKQLFDTNVHQKETDKKVEELFDLIDKYNVKDTQYPTLTLNHTTKMHDRFLIYN